jgi:hypothetical protein
MCRLRTEEMHCFEAACVASRRATRQSRLSSKTAAPLMTISPPSERIEPARISAFAIIPENALCERNGKE